MPATKRLPTNPPSHCEDYRNAREALRYTDRLQDVPTQHQLDPAAFVSTFRRAQAARLVAIAVANVTKKEASDERAIAARLSCQDCCEESGRAGCVEDVAREWAFGNGSACADNGLGACRTR
jgi:hypothetical protein